MIVCACSWVALLTCFEALRWSKCIVDGHVLHCRNGRLHQTVGSSYHAGPGARISPVDALLHFNDLINACHWRSVAVSEAVCSSRRESMQSTTELHHVLEPRICKVMSIRRSDCDAGAAFLATLIHVSHHVTTSARLRLSPCLRYMATPSEEGSVCVAPS